MELALILVALFSLVFVVEVYLGGALPGEIAVPSGEEASRSRLPVRGFFGQALDIKPRVPRFDAWNADRIGWFTYVVSGADAHKADTRFHAAPGE